MKTKRTTRGLLGLMLTLVLVLGLLAGCGGNANSLVGAWDNDDWQISFVFEEGGKVLSYSSTETVELDYEWDGETLKIRPQGESEFLTGMLDEEGNLNIEFFGTFHRVEKRSYGTDMPIVPNNGGESSGRGGMEGELEGEWIHNSGHRMLIFDGSGYMSFVDVSDGSDYSSSGPYSYDGVTLIITTLNDDGDEVEIEGHVDGMGDIIIEIRGEGGWYTRGDSSELVYPDITGPGADLVGEWRNEATGDTITFYANGSVAYSIGDYWGSDSSFSYDGEELSFSDYSGYVDGEGDILLDGVSHWFSRVEG